MFTIWIVLEERKFPAAINYRVFAVTAVRFTPLQTINAMAFSFNNLSIWGQSDANGTHGLCPIF